MTALPAIPCCACDANIEEACNQEHDHRAWDCQPCWDCRLWACGCNGHKDCWKDGLDCKEHKRPPSPVSWREGSSA